MSTKSFPIISIPQAGPIYGEKIKEINTLPF